jgi:hypothetical protein
LASPGRTSFEQFFIDESVCREEQQLFIEKMAFAHLAQSLCRSAFP